jgi:5-oxoprolinase (ATP-hydrolysing) subunit A
VITSPDAVAERVKRFLDSGTVKTIEGKSIKVDARSILIHSDTPGSVNLASTVRRVIEQGGGEVTPATVLLN